MSVGLAQRAALARTAASAAAFHAPAHARITGRLESRKSDALVAKLHRTAAMPSMPRLTHLYSSALCVAFVLAACPSEDMGEADTSLASGADPSVATESTLAKFCDSFCDHASCDGSMDRAECLAECQAEDRIGMHLSEEFLQQVSECYATLPCSSNEDECLGIVGLKLTGKHTELISSCLTRLETCTEALGDTAFSDDKCLVLGFLNDSSRTSAAQCLNIQCEDTGECLELSGAFNF